MRVSVDPLCYQEKPGQTLGIILTMHFQALDQGRERESNMSASPGTDEHSVSSLPESADYYRALFYSLPQHTFVIDKNYLVKEINLEGLQRLNATRQEVIDRKCHQLLYGYETPCHEHGHLCGLKKVLHSKTAFYQHLHKAPKGSAAPQYIRMTPFLIESGEIEQVVATMQEAPGQLMSNQEPDTMEEHFRMLMKSANDIVFLCDPDGNITSVNPAASRIYGYTQEEMLQLNLKDILDPAYTQHAIFWEQKSPADGMPDEPHEVLTYNKSGERVWLEINSRQIIRKDDDRGIMAVARDITDRKRLENQLRQAQKMEAIGTLAGGIAHDFNNILTPIMLHSEQALMKLAENNPAKQNLHHIYQASQRARELVRQILTFAYQGEENRILMKASFSIGETVKLLRSIIPSTIDMKYECTAEKDTIIADPAHLTQVIMNLCTNAVHAMGEKGGAFIIHVSNTTLGREKSNRFLGLVPGDYLDIRISDNGSGIPPEFIDKIFEPYFTTKNAREGTGLGLAVVHGIIKNYGGDISVHSESGEGTTFRILLPVAAGPAERKPDVQSEISGGSERILFVDDEKPVIDAIRPMIESLGYRLTARTSSIEALEAFRYHPEAFDLVITDQAMPNMTGKELAKELIAIRPDIRIIICTGFSEQIDENMADTLGIKGFIMKPAIYREIALEIRNALDT